MHSWTLTVACLATPPSHGTATVPGRGRDDHDLERESEPTMDDARDDRARLRELLAAAERGVVFTGAGVSTGSGLPDFRSADGIWTRFDPRKMTFERYVTDPQVRADSWQMRREFIAAEAEPNDAHRAIADLEQAGHVAVVVTQNIDGLHQAAGSEHVVELHGTAHRSECIGLHPVGGTPDGCGWSAPTTDLLARIDDGDPDPACPLCGGLVKAATISFGQAMDTTAVQQSVDAVRDADLLLAIGSSLQVFPAASLVPAAAGRGIPIAICNAEPTDFDHLAEAVLRDPVEQVLPEVVGALLES